MPLASIGTDMSWREAWGHVSILLRDPSSWLLADMERWEYPVSREWLSLRLIHASLVKEPMPGPWTVPDEPAATMPVVEYRRMIQAHRARG